MLRHMALGAVILTAGLLASTQVSLALVVGDSMRPALLPGDICVVHLGAQPKVGDVVMYQTKSGNRPVLHRVVDAAGNTYRTRGDANPRPDRNPVTRDAVRGVAVRVLKTSRLILLD